MKLKDLIFQLSPEILNREIRRWDENEFSHLKPFVREKFWQDSASINVFRVVGTQDPDCAGLTWLEFLDRGKRMSLNLDLYNRNPGYYREAMKKQPAMYYVSLDGGDLYIADDGNHRTCIAKVAFYLSGETTLHGVTITDYRIDWELKNIYDMMRDIMTLKKLPYDVRVISEVVSRDDSSGWMLEKYNVRLKVRDLKRQTEFLLNLSDARKFLKQLERPHGLSVLSFLRR